MPVPTKYEPSTEDRKASASRLARGGLHSNHSPCAAHLQGIDPSGGWRSGSLELDVRFQGGKRRRQNERTVQAHVTCESRTLVPHPLSVLPLENNRHRDAVAIFAAAFLSDIG